MGTLRLVAALAIATTACVQQPYYDPSTMPEPTFVVGPPGGEMDPEWGPRSSGDYADATVVEPSSDPDDPGYAMGTVTDAEIEVTLDGYGEWVETDDYGSVWRPYATEVGVDFTPYESCGSWVWTDWGWTFACDWDWGWLPFHYGNWGWFDDYWAWVPDYTWTPGAVDWRGGGGYVGWRPTAPSIRDHRGHHFGPSIRDHRGEGPVVRDHRHASSYDSHWRFASESDFGKPHIRAHLFKSPAEGLRVTQLQPKPTLRGRVQAIRAASLMRTRFANARPHTRVGRRFGQTRPTRGFDRSRPPAYDRNPARARAYDRAFRDGQPSVYQPSYRQPVRPYTPPTSHGRMPTTQPGTVRTDPARPPAWRGRDIPQTPITISPSPPDRPARPWHPPPSGTPTWTRPSSPPPRTWTPPRSSSSTPTWTRPSSPPPRSWTPPRSSSTPSWSPSRSSAPSRSYSPPSRSYSPSHSSAPSRSSAPARSSGSFGGGARSHRR